MASIPSLVRPSSSGWPREIHEKKERGKGLDRIAFDLNRRSRSRSGDFRPFKADGMVARLSRHPHPSPRSDRAKSGSRSEPTWCGAPGMALMLEVEVLCEP